MSSKDMMNAKMVVEDVEAPKEQDAASVVMTADDTSTVATEEATNSSKAAPRGLYWKFYGPVFALVGVAALVIVLAVSCSGKDKASSLRLEDAALLDTDTDVNKPPCNKTKQETLVDIDEEPSSLQVEDILDSPAEDAAAAPALEIPKTLPFDDLPPVKPFDANLLKGYSTPEELQEDLAVASQHMLNRVILQNLYKDYYYNQNDVWHSTAERPRPGTVQVAQEAAVTTTTAAASRTNNQEQDADEADHVKSDDNYVYATYGDYLVVWDLQGNQVAQVQMPSQNGGNGDSHDGSWLPPTYINGLLLTPTRVVVLVDAFAQNQEQGEFLLHQQGTQVRLYSKPTSTNANNMELIQTHDLNGIYRDGRWMEDTQTLHLLTAGAINSYPHLVAPLDLGNFQDDYLTAATELAKTKLIPEFVQGVTRSLSINGQMPNFLQVNDWGTTRQQGESIQDIMKGQDHFYVADAPITSFLQVVSLNPEQDDTELTSNVAFAPSHDMQFYASGDHLVIGLVQSQYNETTQHFKEDLFLLHMTENQFHSVATMPGRISSSYTLDIAGDDLRVATTHLKWSPMDRVWPLCGDNDGTDENECMTEAAFNQCFELAINGCQELVQDTSVCPFEYKCNDPEPLQGLDASSTENHVVVLDIATPGVMEERGRIQIGEPHEVITAVRFGDSFSYAMTFDQRDPFYVLDLQPGQAPAIAGALKLDGFSSYLHPLNQDATLLVGIGQNVSGTGLNQVNSGVLITVFDVSDPANPVALASHQVEDKESVDSYSHAEWDAKAVQYSNGKLVLPVSMYHHQWQEVGGDDAWFNGNDFDDAVDQEEDAAQEEKEDWNFEGFMIFTVGYTGIQEAFRVNYRELNDENTCHYCNGGLLSSRSIVFEDGSLMTMQGDAVQSHNLYTGLSNWQMNVTLEGVAKDCCWSL